MTTILISVLIALAAISAAPASISGGGPGLTLHAAPAATSTPNSISGGGPG
jgi:hypothetical protein